MLLYRKEKFHHDQDTSKRRHHPREIPEHEIPVLVLQRVTRSGEVVETVFSLEGRLPLPFGHPHQSP